MFGWLKKKAEWEYGTAGPGNRPARRNRKHGNVQFVLWEAGEQGYTAPYWHDFDPAWWPTFKRHNTEVKPTREAGSA